MRTGVPDEFMRADAPDDWTPDWAPSLEERFHNTVKAWLRRGSALAKQGRQAAASTPVATSESPGMAFVPSPKARCKMDIRSARANDRQKQRWVSLAELGSKPRCSSCMSPAFVGRRLHAGGNAGFHCHASPHMLLGFRGRTNGFSVRRALFSGAASSGQNAANASSSLFDVNAKYIAAQDTISGKPLQKQGGMFEGASLETVEEEKTVVFARTLEASVKPTTSPGLFSSFLGGAADAYDSAVSFVGCALVTSPLGKRYLNAYDGHHTVSASAIRDQPNPATMSGSAYDLVGFSNIDPFEASGRRTGGSSGRMF